MVIERRFGIDLHSIVKPPTTVEFDYDDDVYRWFSERPESETVHIRLLCVQIERPSVEAGALTEFDIPLPQSMIESAIWKPEVYDNLVANPAGGATGLTDEPWRFILQTPLDGSSFCSFALSRKGNVIKGIYLFDDEAFNPAKIADGDSSPSAWRSSGLQIVTLPQKFLQAHSGEVSRRLARTIQKVRGVESALARSHHTPMGFGTFNGILHSCNLELVDIERRSRFEQSIIDAIETIVAASRHATIPWSPLGPQRAALASRQFDFESLPRRIENARSTISSLIQQRNEALNLELTQASHRIAEATLSDSRSMKTIAILTMVLLPGTAVASLFSMNMFDWSATDGSNIATKWLWIYFVVTIPLTALILVFWWLWNRRSLRLTAQRGAATGHESFQDVEIGPDTTLDLEKDHDETKPGTQR